LKDTPREDAPRNIYRERGAYNVVVMRKGHRYQDHFADRVWGGQAQARVAAQRWLYALLKDIDPDTRVRRRPPRGSENKTGILGVSLETNRVGGRAYERYVAQWRDLEKGIQRRRFNVSCYGRDRARALANGARKVGVARYKAELAARQREEATRRLRRAPSQPRQMMDPLSRKGISMAARRSRSGGQPPRGRAALGSR
jgi:hypothetical protein